VAEEGWAGVSDAGKPDAAGAYAEGVGGIESGRVEEGGVSSLRLRLHSCLRQSGRRFVALGCGTRERVLFRSRYVIF
jgi:hypothetical protein